MYKISNINVFNLFPHIFRYLSLKLKIQIIQLFFLMLFAGFFEFLSLAAISPFLKSLQAVNLSYPYTLYIINIPFLKFENQSIFIISNAITFISIVIFTTVIRLINTKRNFRVASLIGIELGEKIYKNDLFLSYEQKIKNDSSIIISALTTQIQTTVNTVNLYLQLLTHIIITIFISIGLLIIVTKVSLLALFIFGCAYYFISFTLKNKLALASKVISDNLKYKVSLLQESIGANREIILDNLQRRYLNKFSKFDRKMRLAQANSQFFAAFPKFLLEGISLVFISSFALSIFFNSKDSDNIIAIIGVFALGAQKLLPSIQVIYGSWASIKSGMNSVFDVLKILERNSETDEIIYNEKLHLKNKIVLENVSYRYNKENRFIFKNLNLEIFNGDLIGIIGKTGLGKSTLIDLIMGLLIPTKGNLYIDGINLHLEKNKIFLKKWRSSIAHVPQFVYLSNKSILENIAFTDDIEVIDKDRVKKVAKIACIDDFIGGFPRGYNTKVGERGILLSGGQRQRIAIARALYKDSRLLIFDEATNSLDHKTEKRVIDGILKNFSNVTIIMISHNVSSLQGCNKIIDMEALQNELE